MSGPVDMPHPTHWRSYGASYRARVATLLAGLLIGAGIIAWLDSRRIVPDELGLGVENWAAPAHFEGRRINSWKLEQYASIYPPASASYPGDILWVGNSQLHAINQIVRERDDVAAHHASSRAGEPVYCLSLPNANLQEHLVTLQWALTRRRIRWLILPLVFDKLRNDGLRSGFELLDSSELNGRLAARPVGNRLLGELARLRDAARHSHVSETAPHPSLADTSLSDWLHQVSLQNTSERQLDDLLSRHWSLWQRRTTLWATFLNDLYQARNWAFAIKSTSKRPMLPIPFARNMAAYREILDIAEAEGANVLVYVAPIRQDVEPPYPMTEYIAWKEDVRQIATRHAATAKAATVFADLDAIVPAKYWGTADGLSEIDFMHFQGEGHRLLGLRIADLVVASSTTAKAHAGSGDVERTAERRN